MVRYNGDMEFLIPINDNIRVIIQGKNPIKAADFLNAFLIEIYPAEEVENLSDEETEFGSGWDEIIININPQRNIPENYLRVFIERRIKLFTEEDEFQVGVELTFDKITPSDSFYKRSDFFTEKKEWLDAVNSNAIFKMIKDSKPLEIIIKNNADFIG